MHKIGLHSHSTLWQQHAIPHSSAPKLTICTLHKKSVLIQLTGTETEIAK